MAKWEDLKFDKMEVDITLAKNFFEKHQYDWTCIVDGQPTLCDVVPDSIIEEHEIKVYYMSDNFFDTKPSYLYTIDSIILANELRQLAQKIKTNEELFCQLEYALRKRPADDVKKDLSLLINKCLHMSLMLEKYPSKNTSVTDRLEFFVMAKSPIYYLFNAVSCLWPARMVKIIATAESAGICTLFIDLWKEVGFHKNISLQIMQLSYVEPEIIGPAEGCVGIVTESSDLDSAVHALVSSTTKSPWRINTVLVQESVYEQFQRALKWRCNVNSTVESHEPHLKQLSTDTQVADGKIFLIDYVGVGPVTSELHPITISAYRTNKELVKIMSQYETPFVSLWCSDSAHAHEIAFSISSPYVWINSYAVFNGSPRIADTVPTTRIGKTNLDTTDEAWTKLDIEKRRDVIRGALRKFIKIDTHVRDVALRIQSGLDSRSGFVEFEKSDLWIGVQKPLGAVYVGTESIDYLIDAIASCIHGNRLIISSELKEISQIIYELKKKGVPISRNAQSIGTSNVFQLYNNRVVYSNYGTIFAN